MLKDAMMQVATRRHEEAAGLWAMDRPELEGAAAALEVAEALLRRAVSSGRLDDYLPRQGDESLAGNRA